MVVNGFNEIETFLHAILQKVEHGNASAGPCFLVGQVGPIHVASY